MNALMNYQRDGKNMKVKIKTIDIKLKGTN